MFKRKSTARDQLIHNRAEIESIYGQLANAIEQTQELRYHRESLEADPGCKQYIRYLDPVHLQYVQLRGVFGALLSAADVCEGKKASISEEELKLLEEFNLKKFLDVSRKARPAAVAVPSARAANPAPPPSSWESNLKNAVFYAAGVLEMTSLRNSIQTLEGSFFREIAEEARERAKVTGAPPPYDPVSAFLRESGAYVHSPRDAPPHLSHVEGIIRENVGPLTRR